MSTFQLLNGLTFAALLFLVASGFTLIFGLMRIVNLAHGALYLLGGYVAYAAATAVALVGFLVDRLLLGFVKGFELRQVLLTLGVALAMDDLALVIWGGDTFSVPLPQWLQGPLLFGSFAYPR